MFHRKCVLNHQQCLKQLQMSDLGLHQHHSLSHVSMLACPVCSMSVLACTDPPSLSELLQRRCRDGWTQHQDHIWACCCRTAVCSVSQDLVALVESWQLSVGVSVRDQQETALKTKRPGIFISPPSVLMIWSNFLDVVFDPGSGRPPDESDFWLWSTERWCVCLNHVGKRFQGVSSNISLIIYHKAEKHSRSLTLPISALFALNHSEASALRL